MGMMKRLYEDFTESVCANCKACNANPDAVSECKNWQSYVLNPTRWDDNIRAMAAENNPGPIPAVERVLTPYEFAQKVQKLYDEYKGCAEEDGHMIFDGMVEDLMRSLGYGEAFDIFNSMSCIWYS